jgi:hypothetical protein
MATEIKVALVVANLAGVALRLKRLNDKCRHYRYIGGGHD